MGFCQHTAFTIQLELLHSYLNLIALYGSLDYDTVVVDHEQFTTIKIGIFLDVKLLIYCYL